MKPHIVILVFLMFSCKNTYWGQKTKQVQDIEINILDKGLDVNKNYIDLIGKPEVKSIKYSITNNSSKNYVLIIDSSNYYLYSNSETTNQEKTTNNSYTDKQLFQLGIKISNTSNRFRSIGYDTFNDYFENLPSLEQTINTGFVVLKPKQVITYKIDFTYPIITNKTNNEGFAQLFLLDDPEYFNIFLFQDKNIILKYLSEENKKKLKKLNAEIYTGILESNKIPVSLK